MERNRLYQSFGHHTGSAANMHNQQELEGQLEQLTTSTERPFKNQPLKDLPSKDAIDRSIKDARQTIIDLTGPDKTELGRPNKPIVIDLDDSPAPTLRKDSSRPNESLHAGLAALREILGSAHSNQSSCDNQLVSEDLQRREAHESLAPLDQNITVQERHKRKEMELANPWRVSDRVLSRLRSHAKSVVGAPKRSPSPANACSASSATNVDAKGGKFLRESVRGQKRPKEGAEEREHSFNRPYMVIDDEEEDWHKSANRGAEKVQSRVKDVQYGNASGETPTDIFPDGIRVLIRELVSEMAEERVSRVKLLLSDAQKAIRNSQRNIGTSLNNSFNNKAVTTTPPGDHFGTPSPLAQLDSRYRVDRDVHIPKVRFHLEVFDSEQHIEEVEVCPITYSSKEPTVPKYKAYTAARSNILSEEDDVLRYMPYFDEREPENMNSLCAHFKDVVKDLPIKYRRDEQAKRLLPLVNNVLQRCGCSIDDTIYCIVNTGTSMQAEDKSTDSELDMENMSATDGVNLEKSRRARLIASLEPREELKILIAREICKAFLDVTGIPMWMVIKQDSRVSRLLMYEKLGKPMNDRDGASRDRNPHSNSSSLAPYTTLGCNVCFMHECLAHGGFDDENVRQRFTGIPSLNIPVPLRPMQITTNGQESDAHDPIQPDQERHCSETCYLKGNVNEFKMSDWSDDDLDLLKSTLTAWSNCKKAACTYSAVLGKPCVEVYSKICEMAPSLPSGDAETMRNLSGPTQKKSPATAIEWAETRTHRHEKRNLFVPCNHSGPCMKNFCDCADEDVACERSCLCSRACKRRYQGCSCGKKGKRCRTDRCECVTLNRECEPDLCTGCGAVEALDPANRYDDEILSRACGNVNLQRGIPKRTLLGISEVEGYGLFMGEGVKAREYLGEYVGELISAAEAERRGAIYDLQGLSYLFSVNKEQEVDATRVGNKFRFINHSSLAPNCSPKVLFVNGVHRIAIFSTRDIEVGEELFFDYGPQYHTSFLSKEPKIKKSVARTTEISEQVQERPATSNTSSKRKLQSSRRHREMGRSERSRYTADPTKRRVRRSRTQDQGSMASTSRKQKDERSRKVIGKRKVDKQSSLLKPASKHQFREQTVARSDLTGSATSISETDDEVNESESASESNHSFPDMHMKDAAAGDGNSSDEEYSEADDGEDDETVVELRGHRRSVRGRNVKRSPRPSRSGRIW